MASLPPSVQESIGRMQQLQNQLQSVLIRKQQYELELKEVEKALGEIEKVSDDSRIYKIVGSFLIQVSKDQAIQELKDRKELLELHIRTLARQEGMLREQIEKLRDEVNRELARLRGTAPEYKGGG